MPTPIPIHLQITITSPPPLVFSTLTSLTTYSTWLPPSSSFKGTTQVSETPVKLGTTYLEPGPAGIRKGEIVEFEEPSKVTFHQPMSLKPYWAGLVIDVRVEMKLKEIEGGGGTLLERDVFLIYPWVLWPFKVFIDREFRTESWRTMEALKRYLETK
jgi:uncharacterized protein YndB with AHSA1/START domain